MVDTCKGTIVEINKASACLLGLLNGKFLFSELKSTLIEKYQIESDSYFENFILKHKKIIGLQKYQSSIDEIVFQIDNGFSQYGLPLKNCYPDKLFLYLTSKCNMSCVYCINKNKRFRGYLPQKKIEDIILDGSKNGLLYIIFTGGEPTLDVNFSAYIEMCMQNRIMPYFSTNGLLLNEKLIVKLKKTGIPLFQISLDASTDNTLYKICGIKGIATIKRNICLSKKNGLNFSIRITVTKDNLNEIGLILDFCERNEIYDISIVPAHKYNKTLTYSDILKIKSLISKRKYPLKIKLRISYEKQDFNNNLAPCEGLIDSATILANGDVVVCSELYTLPYGNIFEKSLKKIWVSEKAERLRERLISGRNHECSNCSQFENCRGGCPAIKNQSNIDFLKKDPRYNFKERSLL